MQLLQYYIDTVLQECSVHLLSLSLLLPLVDSASCVLHPHTSRYISEELYTLFTGGKVGEICHVRLWLNQEQEALWTGV